mgnify:CR=1 FL=1
MLNREIIAVIDDVAHEPDLLPGFGAHGHVLPDNAGVIVDIQALARLGIPGVSGVDYADAIFDSLDAVDCREALLALDHEQCVRTLYHKADGARLAWMKDRGAYATKALQITL